MDKLLSTLIVSALVLLLLISCTSQPPPTASPPTSVPTDAPTFTPLPPPTAQPAQVSTSPPATPTTEPPATPQPTATEIPTPVPTPTPTPTLAPTAPPPPTCTPYPTAHCTRPIRLTLRLRQCLYPPLRLRRRPLQHRTPPPPQNQRSPVRQRLPLPQRLNQHRLLPIPQPPCHHCQRATATGPTSALSVQTDLKTALPSSQMTLISLAWIPTMIPTSHSMTSQASEYPVSVETPVLLSTEVALG